MRASPLQQTEPVAEGITTEGGGPVAGVLEHPLTFGSGRLHALEEFFADPPAPEES
jgi:hypothetical protein